MKYSTRIIRPALVMALATASIGCGDGGLDPFSVTTIPDGNATGTAASGIYDIEIRTVDCDGICAGSSGIFSLSFCDIGDVDQETITITQSDGHLSIDWDEPISRLEGGLDQSGQYDVGGVGTQGGRHVRDHRALVRHDPRRGAAR